MSRLLNILMVGLAYSAMACGGGTSTPADDASIPEASSELFGLIIISHQENRENPRVRDELTAMAWFVDHPSVTRDAVLEFLNVPYLGQGVPMAVDRCQVNLASIERDDILSAASGAVYFMDAGVVEVEARGVELLMDGRYLPDFHDNMSGLVYDGVARGVRLTGRDRRVIVDGHGGGEVGPFQFELNAPHPMRFVSIDEKRLRGPAISLEREAQEPLRLRWKSSRSQRDSVTVEYERRGFDRLATITCLVEDDGAFEISGELLSQLPEFGLDQTDRISATRYALEAFDAPGIDEGQVVALSRDAIVIK